MRLLFYSAVMACGTASLGAKTLLVLPVMGDTSRTGDLKTVSRLYHDAVAAQYDGQTLAAPDSSTPCNDRECALQMAKTSGADEVIFSDLNRLGSRWVFSSTLLNIQSGEAFNQHLEALSVEDMEAVTHRMADALLARKTIDQAATLDNVTGVESAEAPKRRRSFYSSGLALGYLWPRGNSFAYRVADYAKFPYTYADQTNSRITHLSWINDWELRNDLLVGFEMSVEFLDKAPIAGGDFNLDYLPVRGDITPVFGGGMGLHYVPPDENPSPGKRNSGPTFNVEGGLMLFRTYDVHVLLRGQYRIVFNSDIDNGFVTDVALTYRVKPLKNEVNWKSERGYMLAGAGLILLLGLLAL